MGRGAPAIRDLLETTKVIKRKALVEFTDRSPFIFCYTSRRRGLAIVSMLGPSPGKQQARKTQRD
jgi:hypothetical protein